MLPVAMEIGMENLLVCEVAIYLLVDNLLQHFAEW